MRPGKLIINLIQVIFVLLLVSCSTTENEQEDITDYSQYVNPMIGTGGHGHTFPGAALPFGMVQISPDNGRNGWDWCSGYHYSSDSIAGFSHLHLNGTGIGDMLDISVLPSAENIPITRNDSLGFDVSPYYATFSHDEEEASPGYYRVRLKESGILAEFTASFRSAFHRYTFPEKDTVSIIIDLGFHKNWDRPVDTHIKVISDSLLTGFRFSEGWAPDQKVYFAMRFSKSLIEFQGSGRDTLYISDPLSIESPSSLAVLKFQGSGDPIIQVKVGISPVSEQNALINLNAELPDWDFDKVRESAKRIWNHELSRIEITGASPEQMTVFYTALYHSMLSPNIFSDINFQYRGPDDLIHTDSTFVNYHTFSLWDTYRAEHPLFTLILPEKARDFIHTLIAHYRFTGKLPVWTLWGNETNTMIGYHSIPVITDAFLKGLLHELNPDTIFHAMASSAIKPGGELNWYERLGYVPADTIQGSVSKTLEYAFDDWCIAQVARELNKTQEFNRFMNRAASYRNLFDPAVDLMRPRLSNGSWKAPFDPFYAGYNNDYVEGNAWQYSWYVPHDVNSLISLMGGKEKFALKLDSLFSLAPPSDQELALDVTGLIGQYAHGNEPSHHIPYLYNYCGQPWKTQEKVRNILNTMYSNKPDGLAGNEDCGQMSAWYIFSAMGFYPVNPSSGLYDIGAPLFPGTIIRLANGKTFSILAENLSADNKYVGSITLNDHAYDKYILPHDSIMSGGILKFEMVPQPKRN